ncbi:MAG TPA: hypothetical protein PLG17_10680 [Thermodesulfobacteriota bacterium]|nr:hypothetical protein [Thermodesulfobacteriota bacterium]
MDTSGSIIKKYTADYGNSLSWRLTGKSKQILLLKGCELPDKGKRDFIDQANIHPLNQAALKALRKAKVPVEDHLLYALQLADWGTEGSEGKLEVPFEVSNMVHLLYGEDPRVGMKYLTRLPGEDEEFDPSAQVKEGGVRRTWRGRY